MSDKLYISVKRGVFIQGIAGITNSYERAKLWTKFLKYAERDNYHSFEILSFNLNEMVVDLERAAERSDEVLPPHERMKGIT